MFGWLCNDYNRHSSYNMAVTFFRIMVFFMVAALIALLAYLTYTPPLMHEEGVHSFTITSLDKHTIRSRRSTTTTYHASCVDENGGPHNQKITAREYATLIKGQTYECPMYSADSGAMFISFGGISNVKAATKEFYSRNPNGTMIAMRIGVIALGVLAFLNLSIALAELRRERKFRDETAIMRNGIDWQQYK